MSDVQEKKEKIKIDIDNTVEDVLKYDEEGYTLTFSVERSKFMKLTTKDLEKLTRENLLQYNIAREANILVEKSVPHDGSLQVLGPVGITGTDLLEVHGGDSKFHYTWQMDSDLPQMDTVTRMKRKGYEFANADEVETIGKNVGGRSVIRESLGNLVLMRTPKENAEAIQRSHGERSKERAHGVISNTKEELRRSGISTFDENKGNSGSNWGPARNNAKS